MAVKMARKYVTILLDKSNRSVIIPMDKSMGNL